MQFTETMPLFVFLWWALKVECCE